MTQLTSAIWPLLWDLQILQSESFRPNCLRNKQPSLSWTFRVQGVTIRSTSLRSDLPYPQNPRLFGKISAVVETIRRLWLSAKATMWGRPRSRVVRTLLGVRISLRKIDLTLTCMANRKLLKRASLRTTRKCLCRGLQVPRKRSQACLGCKIRREVLDPRPIESTAVALRGSTCLPITHRLQRTETGPFSTWRVKKSSWHLPNSKIGMLISFFLATVSRVLISNLSSQRSLRVRSETGFSIRASLTISRKNSNIETFAMIHSVMEYFLRNFSVTWRKSLSSR